MHSTRNDDATDQRTRPRLRGRGSLVVLLTLLLLFLLIAFLPPLVNVSRFQKRIAGNISTALGRPVHFGLRSVLSQSYAPTKCKSHYASVLSGTLM